MKGLDRYLETEPHDDFTPFCENVYEKVSDEAYEKMDEAKFINSETESAFMMYLFLTTESVTTASQHLTIFFKQWFFYTNGKDYYKNQIQKLK